MKGLKIYALILTLCIVWVTIFGFSIYNKPTQKESGQLIATGVAMTTPTGIKIQLPDKFKGKKFSVVVGIKELGTPSINEWIDNVNVYVSSYDYANATFTVEGWLYYTSEMPNDSGWDQEVTHNIVFIWIATT